MGVARTVQDSDPSSTASATCDPDTGLLWQNGPWSEYSVAAGEAYCESVGMFLPTFTQLQALYTDGTTDTSLTSGMSSVSFFWSSTLVAGSSGHAWYVYFGNGDTSYSDVSYPSFVRCVR
jgi:hypothetical protein